MWASQLHFPFIFVINNNNNDRKHLSGIDKSWPQKLHLQNYFIKFHLLYFSCSPEKEPVAGGLVEGEDIDDINVSLAAFKFTR